MVDQSRCIGCHACTTACKSENEVPLSVTRTFVKYVDAGVFPEAKRSFQVTRCNQCEEPPCVDACPTSAMFRRADGIVDFDKSACIGCKACIAACPYDAIFINPADHSAEKCNFCAHRLDVGLEPACVVVCPTEALLVGDLNDPESQVAKVVHRDSVTVRRPEKRTRPKLFYKGADQAALDPLAARRPGGGLFMWSEQEATRGGRSGRGEGGGGAGRRAAAGEAAGRRNAQGAAGLWNSSAAAVVSYDVPRKAPWDFRVSLYTWTKSISAGAYLVPLLLVLLGVLPADSSLWRAWAPAAAAIFLALTGGLLIWDLEHPKRCLLLFKQPQWRSWLVRGGFVLGAYGVLLALHFVLGSGPAPPPAWLGWLGGPLAVLAAVYTAFLFGQAKARDLWQNPLLPAHFLVQALLAGGAATALLALAAGVGSGVYGHALLVFGVASGVHLLMLAGEVLMPAPTAHAKQAEREMTSGRYRAWFRVGVVGALAGAAAAWVGAGLGAEAVLGVGLGMETGQGLGAGWGLGAAVAGLVGLLAYEHAYVQAGQSVPLA